MSVGRVTRWLLLWLVWTCGIVLAGALLGAVLFPLLGRLGGSSKDLGALALLGVRNLGFYAFVWAPGAAIVLVVMDEAKRRRDLLRARDI